MNKTSDSRPYSIVLIAIFFLSGAAGLTYEIIWLRQLNLVFGVTSFALATVLAAFMSGLALGSYYFGKKADSIRNPLELYAYLEFGIGFYALMITYLFRGLDVLYIGLGHSLSSGSVALDIFRVLGAFLIILIPTTFMGGTLPLVSKFFIHREKEVGFKIGLLYGINTLGATAGTFATGFFLIKLYGIQYTTFIGVAINLLVGAGALLITKTAKSPVARDSSGTVDSNVITDKKATNDRTVQNLVLLTFGLSGFAALCYEVLWTRALIYFLGLTTYAFTTMLTAFLMGIAGGSFIILKFVDRLKNPILWFALIELLIGLLALFLMPIIHAMHPFSQILADWFGRASWWGVVGNRFIIAFIIMLLPTLCMGATFPLVVKYYTDNVAALGTSLGKVYAVNTIGSILGSVAAGFVLIPFLGIRLGITVVVIINITIATILFFKNPANSPKQKKLLGGAGVLSLLFVFLLFDNTPMILSSAEFTGLQRRYDLLYVKESSDASIAVLQDKVTKERELNINGESTAFTIYQDMQVHKLLGHLPPLLHPAPTDFLVVGFGFGSTAYAATLYPDAQVDCVELLPQEIETASYFEKQNHGVVNFPNFNLIIGDGRDYIKLAEKKYDVISFNAIHPKISPNLYTLDFYQQCKNLLKEDGIIIAWMPPNAITASEFRSLVKTFLHTFSNSSLWYVNPSHLLILGSSKPLTIDWQRLNQRLQDARIRADLKETNLENPLELLSNFIVTGNELEVYVATAGLNTDDQPLIEFSRVHTVTVNIDVIRQLQRIKQDAFPYLVNFSSPEEEQQVKKTLQIYNAVKNWVVEGQILSWTGQYSAATSMYQKALALQPDNANAQYLLSLIDRRKSELEQLISFNPFNAKAIKALGDLYLEEGKLKDAYKLLSRALVIDPGYTEAAHSLGVIYFNTGQIDKALGSFNKVLTLDPHHGAAHFYSGQCYWRMGKAQQALFHFEQAVDADPDLAMNHLWYGLALEKTGRKGEASKALQQALVLEPSFTAAEEALVRLTK